MVNPEVMRRVFRQDRLKFVSLFRLCQRQCAIDPCRCENGEFQRVSRFRLADDT